MRSLKTRIVCVGSLLLLGALSGGCSKNDGGGTDAANASPPTPVGTGAKKPQGAGGVPDQTIYPAPSGVQTGLQGGAKK